MKEKLIEVYKKIQELNPMIVLSGSLALSLQGIKIPREPHDIDIFIPIQWKDDFKLPEGMKFKEEDLCGYSQVEFFRRGFILDEIHIDVFFPESEDSFHPFETVGMYYKGEQYVEMLKWDDIVSFKLSHGFDKSESKVKHKADVLYILQNN